MRSLIAALFLCVFGLSNADAHARHHHHHGVAHPVAAQSHDYSYPVDDRYSYMNKGEWVWHERGPKALYEWQKHSKAHQEAKPVVYASFSPANYSTSRPSDCYGIPWCGCFMRHLLGVADKSFNLARRWASYGTPASGPAPHVIGVMPHHVFMVLQVISPRQVLAISGNDGHAVRTRVRSIGGVIAWRQA
jgi:hypothetical protein